MEPYRTPAAVEATPFACVECGEIWRCPGDCICGGGPRVDWSEPGARALALECDDRRVERQLQFTRWMAVVLGMWFGAATLAFQRMRSFEELVMRPIGAGAVALSTAMVAWAVLRRILPPVRRFPELARRRDGGIASSLHPGRRSLAKRVLVLAVVAAALAQVMPEHVLDRFGELGESLFPTERCRYRNGCVCYR